MVDYRDPKTKTNMNFAKPVVDIAASSRSQAGAKLASWGCSLTEIFIRTRLFIVYGDLMVQSLFLGFGTT